MKVKAFCVYDSKAQAFMSPFFQHATGAAVRMFTDLAHDKSTMVGKHPEDFSLMEIGTFDDASGELSAIKVVNLGLAASYVKPLPVPGPGVLDLMRGREEVVS